MTPTEYDLLGSIGCHFAEPLYVMERLRPSGSHAGPDEEAGSMVIASKSTADITGFCEVPSASIVSDPLPDVGTGPEKTMVKVFTLYSVYARQAFSKTGDQAKAGLVPVNA